MAETPTRFLEDLVQFLTKCWGDLMEVSWGYTESCRLYWIRIALAERLKTREQEILSLYEEHIKKTFEATWPWLEFKFIEL